MADREVQRQASNDNAEGGQDRAPESKSARRSERGFAAMDAEKQRQIASKGGRAAHEKGTAHEFTPDEARNAGKKGGEVVSQNREHMAQIGRKGGESKGGEREVVPERRKTGS